MNLELNKHFFKMHYWYDQRDMRERLLIVMLSWAILYFMFYYVVASGIDFEIATYQAEIQQKNVDISNTKKQMADIVAITQSPLYKQWEAAQKTQQNLLSAHTTLLNVSPAEQWQSVFNVILQSQPNVSLLQIKNKPEFEYNPLNLQNLKNKIYAQSLVMTIQSDYLDFMNYITLLEKQLPMVHWDKLTYEVIEYPIAKIEMEFSILYEKSGA